MSKRSDLFWGAVKTGRKDAENDTTDEKKRLEESRKELERKVDEEVG